MSDSNLSFMKMWDKNGKLTKDYKDKYKKKIIFDITVTMGMNYSYYETWLWSSYLPFMIDFKLANAKKETWTGDWTPYHGWGNVEGYKNKFKLFNEIREGKVFEKTTIKNIFLKQILKKFGKKSKKYKNFTKIFKNKKHPEHGVFWYKCWMEVYPNLIKWDPYVAVAYTNKANKPVIEKIDWLYYHAFFETAFNDYVDFLKKLDRRGVYKITPKDLSDKIVSKKINDDKALVKEVFPYKLMEELVNYKWQLVSDDATKEELLKFYSYRMYLRTYLAQTIGNKKLYTFDLIPYMESKIGPGEITEVKNRFEVALHQKFEPFINTLNSKQKKELKDSREWKMHFLMTLSQQYNYDGVNELQPKPLGPGVQVVSPEWSNEQYNVIRRAYGNDVKTEIAKRLGTNTVTESLSEAEMYRLQKSLYRYFSPSEQELLEKDIKFKESVLKELDTVILKNRSILQAPNRSEIIKNLKEQILKEVGKLREEEEEEKLKLRKIGILTSKLHGLKQQKKEEDKKKLGPPPGFPPKKEFPPSLNLDDDDNEGPLVAKSLKDSLEMKEKMNDLIPQDIRDEYFRRTFNIKSQMEYFYKKYEMSPIKSDFIRALYTDTLKLNKDIDKHEKSIEMLKSLRIQKKFTKEKFDNDVKKKINEIYNKFKTYEILFGRIYPNYEIEVNEMTNKEMIDNELEGISDNESGNETDATDKMSSHDEVAMIQKRDKEWDTKIKEGEEELTKLKKSIAEDEDVKLEIESLTNAVKRHENEKDYKQAIKVMHEIEKICEEHNICDISMYNKIADLYINIGEMELAETYFKKTHGKMLVNEIYDDEVELGVYKGLLLINRYNGNKDNVELYTREKNRMEDKIQKKQEEADKKLIAQIGETSGVKKKGNLKKKKKKKGRTSPSSVKSSSSDEEEPMPPMTGFLTVEQLKKNQEEDRIKKEKQEEERKKWREEQERLKSQKREKIKQPEGSFLETVLMQEFLGMKNNTIEDFKSRTNNKNPSEVEQIIMWDSILSVLIDLEYDVLQNLDEPAMGILGGGFAAHLLTRDVEGGPYPTDDIDIKIYPVKKPDKKIVETAREKMYNYLDAKDISIRNPQRGKKANEIYEKINSKMKKLNGDEKPFLKEVMISYMYSLDGELASLEKKSRLLRIELNGDGRKNGYTPPRRNYETQQDLEGLYQKTMLDIDTKKKEIRKDKARTAGLYVIKIAVDINRKYKFIETFPYSKNVYYEKEFDTERKAVCDIGFWKDGHMIPSIMGLLKKDKRAGGFIHMIEKPWLPFHEYKYKGKKINLPIIHKDNLIEEKKVLVEDKELLFNSQEAIEHKTPNWIKQRELLQKITSRKKGGGRTLKIRRRKKKTKRKGKKRINTRKKRRRRRKSRKR